MTKLADAIRRSQRIESAPMGFGAARPAAKASMVVGAIARSGESLDAYKDSGADLVLVDARSGRLSDGEAKKLGGGGNGVVLGLLASSPDGGQAADLKEAGFDFIVFEPETTPASALLEEDVGYVLILPSQADELFLRSLDSLSLDALYLETLPTPLTVARQLELNRIGMFAHKPLICLVEPGVSAEDLRCLRAAGCAVVVATGAAGAKSLKETVMSLPPRKTRRDDSRMVALPRGSASVEEDDEEDD